MTQPRTKDQTEEAREIRELRNITRELKRVEANTGSSWRALWRGMLQGGGAVIGSIVAVILLGVFLSVIGVIPALHTIVDAINGALANIKHY